MALPKVCEQERVIARSLRHARDGVREIACVLAANGAQAFRRDAPLADEEGN